jgi:hypothetical protein
MIVEAGTLRSELVHKFNCGWILDSVKPESIRKLLLNISGNPDLYQKRVHAVRVANSRLNISWESMSEKLIRIYDAPPLVPHTSPFDGKAAERTTNAIVEELGIPV